MFLPWKQVALLDFLKLRNMTMGVEISNCDKWR